MNTVHFVMSDAFAGIEQHVDELLSNNLLKNPILICNESIACLLYTSPSPRDTDKSRMPSSA